MNKNNTPIILDNWLWILNQLSTTQGVLGRNMTTLRGKRCSPNMLMFLRENDLIWSSTEGVPGYRLFRPLNQIQFKELVNLWSLSSVSYIRRLLLQYGDLSLATVTRLPTIPRTPYNTSLDSVCHVVRTLRTDTFMTPDAFYPKRYTPAYGYMIAKQLSQQGLVTAYKGKGYALATPHVQIRIGDIIPVISLRCATLSKILSRASDTPLTTLFK